MAMALARIEAAPNEPVTQSLLDAAFHGPRAHVVGVTGPPGVGKSTLLSSLVKAYRRRGQTVGVIAVDPSSRRSGGALLGDRMRLELDPDDQGVFVRSMAARDRFGGLAPLTQGGVVLMRAVYDVVFVETVGVGQTETAVASVSDTVLLCIQPGSGDSLQYMKSGIAEIPDLAIVNKADLGGLARKAKADLESALALATSDQEGWTVPVMLVSAGSGQGIDELIERLASRVAFLRSSGRLEARREEQVQAWLEEGVLEEFGRHGLERLRQRGESLQLRPGASPFKRLREIARTLRERASLLPQIGLS